MTVMHTLYLVDNGVQLKKRSNRIVVKKNGKIIEEFSIIDLKRVLVFGNNQVSTELLRHLASKGIEVAFLLSHGRFKFRIVPETSRNVYLRMAQHDCFHDRAFRSRLASTIVEGKLKNQRSFLLRCHRNQPGVDLENQIRLLEGCIKNIKASAGIEKVMGLEGFGSKAYFEAYGKLLIGDFHFSGRKYHPAPDPINALLGFGYMLLFSELNGLLEAHGFDPFIGFLHGIRYGRASLASDMIEELRSPIVDRLVIYLVNKRIIKPNQFKPAGEKGVKMDDRAKRSFLANYERFMTVNFMDVTTRKRKNFREIIRGQVREIERAILNKSDYRPYVFRS